VPEEVHLSCALAIGGKLGTYPVFETMIGSFVVLTYNFSSIYDRSSLYFENTTKIRQQQKSIHRFLSKAPFKEH